MPRSFTYRARWLVAAPVLGESIRFWIGFTVVAAVLAVIPSAISRFDLLLLNGLLAPVPLAIGLALMWGQLGILSLGQMTFYGIGGYAYGVAGINWVEHQGNTDLALLVGILVPVALALVIGVVMFYGRLRGVYVAILLLVVTLVLHTFMQQTASSQWRIGAAFLGGDNGLGRFSGVIEEPPSLDLGFGRYTRSFSGIDPSFYYLALIVILALVIALRALLRSRWGYIFIAIRDEPERAETFGHNVRLVQLVVFVFCATLAAFSGILFVSWGNFITPNVFGVTSAILPVVWVAVGGRKSIVGPIVATIVLGWLAQQLAAQGNYTFIVLGTLLVVVVMVAPDGVAGGLVRTWRSLESRLSSRSEGRSQL